jgi:hypothetical protein
MAKAMKPERAIPRLELRIVGGAVVCGRPGCAEPIGLVDLESDPPITLSGRRWVHAAAEDGSRQWKQARRARRMPPTLSGALPSGWPSGTPWSRRVLVETGVVVVCPNPKCRARQRVPLVMRERPG